MNVCGIPATGDGLETGEDANADAAWNLPAPTQWVGGR